MRSPSARPARIRQTVAVGQIIERTCPTAAIYRNGGKRLRGYAMRYRPTSVPSLAAFLPGDVGASTNPA